MSTSSNVKRTRQGPLTLWHMMTLGQMWQAAALRPQLHWSRAFKIFLLPGMGLYNSAMRLAERAIWGKRIREFQLEQAPLFIIGHWRSGTTLLHNLVAQDPQFTFPTMYQTAFCNHFLLTQDVVTKLTGGLIPKSRPMDNLPAGWDIPQEEDIAMAIQSLMSPYMLAADPDRMDLVRPYWDMTGLSPEDRARWKSLYVEYLKRVTLKDPQRRRLVLKSPVNTLRIPLLLEMFPDAKFLSIYRNPYDVYNSCVHLRRTLFRENCLGKPHLRELEESVFWVHEFAFRAYQRDRHLIPEGRLHEVRFEDLESDILGELERAYSALGLDNWPELERIIEPQVPGLKRYKKNVFASDREQMDMVYERLKFIFEHYGYPHPAEAAATAEVAA
jgi:hypothetical protein